MPDQMWQVHLDFTLDDERTRADAFLELTEIGRAAWRGRG